MAELWVRDLIAWLRAAPGITPGSAVLDYGCGYFDVGLALAPRVGRVDGFDIEPRTVEAARARAAALPAARIFDRSDALPCGMYDLIVVNSVLQYISDESELSRTLQLFRTLLRPGERGAVLVADIIPPDYSAAKDALRSLWVALRNGVLGPMIAHLWKAACKSEKLKLQRIACARLRELAAAAGFHCERLARNLTPSRQRYSCLLKRI